MRPAFILASVLATVATGKPVMEEKRYMVTETVLETATLTVTGSNGWGNWGWTRSSATASNTVSVIRSSSSSSSTPPPASTPSPTAVSSPSAAPTSSPTSTPSETASSSSAAAQPTSSGSGSVSTYADPILTQHNLHRDNHTAPAIVWNNTLAEIAAQIAASCVYAHDTKTGGGGYGQNIGAGAKDTEINKMITNQMYNDEMMLYPGYGSEPSMSDFERWGHFSQIVWKDTTSVGCATQYCSQGLQNVASNVDPYFTVCNYSPAGNFGGQYAANIAAPVGNPVVIL